MKTDSILYIFMLTMCLWGLSAVSIEAQNPDGAYWALVGSNIVYEGERSQGMSAGWKDIVPNSVEFSWVKSIATKQKQEPGIYIDGKKIDPVKDKEEYLRATTEGTSKIEIRGGDKKVYFKEIMPLYITWKDPITYVALGSENTIYIDCEAKREGRNYFEHQFDSYGLGPTLNIPALQTMSANVISSKLLKDTVCTTASVYITQEVIVLPETSSKYNFDYLKKHLIDRRGSPKDTEEALEKYIDASQKLRDKEGGDYSTYYSYGSGYMREDGRIVHTPFSPPAWNMTMHLTKGAAMVVKFAIQIEYIQEEQKKLDVIQYYLYKCYTDGGDHEVTTYASSEGGEDGGTPLPPWIIVPTLIGLPIGAWLVTKGKNKKTTKDKKKETDKQKEKKKDEKKEEKKRKPSSYVMILYKDFGSTLAINAEPQIVGARIEEIDAEGNRIERPDLNANIEVTEGENIRIVSRGTAGKYRCAKIVVPQAPIGTSQGWIYFTFKAEHGSLKNKVVFNIADPKVVFCQDNLTLPVGYDRVARLPFVITGIAGDQISHCEATIGSSYSVNVAPSDENPSVWYAFIRETDKKKMLPGQVYNNNLHITAYTKNGASVEGELPVIRMQMGLHFKCCDHVDCFLEEYREGFHNKNLILQTDYSTFAPAQVYGTFSLLTWNEKTHKVVRVLPEGEVPYELKAIPLDPVEDAKEIDYMSKETGGMSDQQLLDSLDIDAITEKVESDNSVKICIFSKQYMDAPSRRKVKLRLKMTYKEVEYIAEQPVWLFSQPLRALPHEEMQRELEIDDLIRNRLEYIKESIFRIGAYDNLFPVVKCIDLMRSGYSHRFGYDTQQVHQVITTYQKYCRGELLGANATPDRVEELGFLAETMRALATSGEQIEEWMDKHGGWKTRMALGLISLGWSETALTACSIQKKMIDVVEREKNPGGAWDAFIVGVTEAGKEILWSEGLALGMKKAGGLLKQGNPELMAKIEKKVADVGGKVQKDLGYLAKDVKDVYKDIKSYAAEGFGRKAVKNVDEASMVLKNTTKECDELVKDFRRTAIYSEAEEAADILYNESMQNAMKKVKEFEGLYCTWASDRTEENLKAMERIILEFQSSKVMQRALANYNGKWGNNLRARFYDMQNLINESVQRRAQELIAEELRKRNFKVEADDIYAFHATNSNAESLHNGTSITRDLDVTQKVKGKRVPGGGDPIDFDVPQDIAEECYARAYKEKTGYTIKQNDHAVVQTGSPEMIGAGEKDLQKAFDRRYMKQSFEDLNGVARAFEHKVDEWVMRSYVAEAQKITHYAHIREEGIRQAAKLAKKSLIPMAIENKCLIRLKKEDLLLLNLLDRTQVSSSGPTAGLSMVEFEKLLKTRFNMDVTDVGTKLKDILLEINSYKLG